MIRLKRAMTTHEKKSIVVNVIDNRHFKIYKIMIYGLENIFYKGRFGRFITGRVLSV